MEREFGLERFLDAQQKEIDNVRTELKNGRKQGHWMWFVFPQLKGLGKSWMANQYAIASRAEAEAYTKHPVLGQRLTECTKLVNLVQGRCIEEIFGEIDAMKFRSSMTLFADVDPSVQVFSKALEKYFDGQKDRLTLDLLR